MARGKNYLPSRGLRLLAYQDKVIRETMEVEGLSYSGSMRFLMMLGAHATQMSDRTSDKLDMVDAKLDNLLDEIIRLGRRVP